MKKFKKIPKKYVFEQNYSNMVMEDFENFSMDFLNENQETYLNENSLGEKIVPDDDPIKLQNFWKWFGNSKCVDEKGRPLVVYHMSRNKFDKFDIDKSNGGSWGDGFYFSSDKLGEWMYGETEYSCYLKLDNPCIINFPKTYGDYVKLCNDILDYHDKDSMENYYDYFLGYPKTQIAVYAFAKIYRELYGDNRPNKIYKDKGFDSVVIKDSIIGSQGDVKIKNEFLVFNPNQIKSVNNAGTFSSTSDNIFESENKAISTLPNENSLGEKIVPDDDPIKLQNFWKWFNGSKVVDKQGRPLVVYHGTNNKFDSFDKSTFGNNAGYAGGGFYFSEISFGQEFDEETATHYGSNIVSVYIDVKNPLLFNKKTIDKTTFNNLLSKHRHYGGKFELLYDESNSDVDLFKSITSRNSSYFNITPQEWIEIFEELGFDGLKDDENNWWQVFEPSQIKSVNNKGTFSSSSDNIFESENRAISTLPNENSLGEKIIPDDDPVKLQNFWNWFGDSKVVDEQGRPLVVYHGGEIFDTFRPSDRFGDKYFFITNKNVAQEYAKRYIEKGNGEVKAVYLSISDFDFDNTGEGEFYDKFESDSDMYVAYRPNQIKSVNNAGAFSSTSDNIFEALNLEEFPNRQKVTVYHGSSNKNLKIKDDSLIYFTTNKEDAIRWADRFILGGKKNKNSYVYTAEITFDKPYVIGDTSVNSEYKKYEDQPEKEKKEIFSEIFYDDLNENRSELISKGYDCFIDNQISDNITYYIIPSQFMDNIKWLKIKDKESLNEINLFEDINVSNLSEDDILLYMKEYADIIIQYAKEVFLNSLLPYYEQNKYVDKIVFSGLSFVENVSGTGKQLHKVYFKLGEAKTKDKGVAGIHAATKHHTEFLDMYNSIPEQIRNKIDNSIKAITLYTPNINDINLQNNNFTNEELLEYSKNIILMQKILLALPFTLKYGTYGKEPNTPEYSRLGILYCNEYFEISCNTTGHNCFIKSFYKALFQKKKAFKAAQVKYLRQLKRNKKGS